MLTVGSLFAGIGGFDLGLERTGGFQVKWQVEIDDYCQRVLAKHWPHVTRYGDIRSVTDVEPVDVLCGGFPCQDISNAGKRAGIDGERSGLWSEYVRLIRLVRPRYVLVENVAALLGRGMGRVLGDLAACGFDAEWQTFSACRFGAPHLRERTFALAYANGNGLEADPDETSVRRAPLLRRLPGRLGEMGVSGQWAGARPVGARPLGMDDGISSDVHRLKGLGNAIVPQIAEWIGERILEHERGVSK